MNLKSSVKSAARAVLGEHLSSGLIAYHGRVRAEAREKKRLLLQPAARRSAKVLRSYHNRYAGGTCVVMGNGPSLRRTDVGLLVRVPTFGLNRIYLARDWLGFDPTFLVCVNRLVLEQCSADLAVQPMPKFFSWRGRELFDADTDIVFLRPATDEPSFCVDPSQAPMWEGGTVTYVALQLAYWFGFARVVLVGVDHHFTATGPAHKTVLSSRADSDHFDPRYFGPGFRWQLPDLVTSEKAYRLAGEAYARDGREILDATVGGNLHVFPKVDLREGLEDG